MNRTVFERQVCVCVHVCMCVTYARTEHFVPNARIHRVSLKCNKSGLSSGDITGFVSTVGVTSLAGPP